MSIPDQTRFVISVDERQHVARLTETSGTWTYNGAGLCCDTKEDHEFAMALICKDIVSRAIDIGEATRDGDDGDEDVTLIITLQLVDESDPTLLTTVLRTAVDPTAEDVAACVHDFMRFAGLAGLAAAV